MLTNPARPGARLRLEWMARGACLTEDPELFFTEEGEDPAPAEVICADCPVRSDCYSFAVADPHLLGTWGGTTRPLPPTGRRHSGGSVEGLEAWRVALAAEAEQRIRTGIKACRSCRTVLPLEKFHRQAGAADGRRSSCAECVNAAERARVAA